MCKVAYFTAATLINKWNLEMTKKSPLKISFPVSPLVAVPGMYFLG